MYCSDVHGYCDYLPDTSGDLPDTSARLPDTLAELLQMAKQVINDGNVKLGLECYKKAYEMQPEEKLERRIARMQVSLDLYHQ